VAAWCGPGATGERDVARSGATGPAHSGPWPRRPHQRRTRGVAAEAARRRGGRHLGSQESAPAGVQGGNQEVNIVTTRFGLIQASESELIRIPEGLLGFRSFTQYLHFPDPVVAGLTWLQSVSAPDLAFALVAPPLAI